MIKIEFDNRTDRIIEDDLTDSIIAYVAKTVETEGIDDTVDVEVSYSMVTPDEIHTLNHDYRDKDQATDVLSFPMNDFESDDDVIELEEGMPLVLGDIVVNLDQAEKQAKEYGNTFLHEVCYLSVHSVLHLLGYDHMEPEDKTEMRAREKEVLAEMAQ